MEDWEELSKILKRCQQRCYNIFIDCVMKVDKLFENFSPLMKEKGPELVKKVGHTYHFEIQKEKG